MNMLLVLTIQQYMNKTFLLLPRKVYIDSVCFVIQISIKNNGVVNKKIKFIII